MAGSRTQTAGGFEPAAAFPGPREPDDGAGVGGGASSSFCRLEPYVGGPWCLALPWLLGAPEGSVKGLRSTGEVAAPRPFFSAGPKPGPAKRAERAAAGRGGRQPNADGRGFRACRGFPRPPRAR